MIYYLYDGTFEGLLTALDLGISSTHATVEIMLKDRFQPDLFSQEIEVTTDSEIARSFAEAIEEKFSHEIFLDIGYVFLSEIPGMEGLLLQYIRLLFAEGNAFSQNFSNPVVFKVQRIRSQVSYEIQRYHGFVRFRKLKNNIYYAPIEPDHNIVQFLAPHFSERFADQSWLIHDVKRDTGIFYDGRRCIFLSQVDIHAEVVVLTQSAPSDHEDFFDDTEIDYQSLWNQYFQSTAITERRRKQLQRQRMPKRYWKWMVETIEDR